MSRVGREKGVRADIAPGSPAHLRESENVVFFAVAGLIAVLWKRVDRVGDSGALLIGAMLLVLTAICLPSRSFGHRSRAAFHQVNLGPRHRGAGIAAPSSSASSAESP